MSSSDNNKKPHTEKKEWTCATCQMILTEKDKEANNLFWKNDIICIKCARRFKCNAQKF